jgi:hypothetical protein
VSFVTTMPAARMVLSGKDDECSGPTSHDSCSGTIYRRGWEFYGPWDCGGVSAGT